MISDIYSTFLLSYICGYVEEYRRINDNSYVVCGQNVHCININHYNNSNDFDNDNKVIISIIVIVLIIMIIITMIILLFIAEVIIVIILMIMITITILILLLITKRRYQAVKMAANIKSSGQCRVTCSLLSVLCISKCRPWQFQSLYGPCTFDGSVFAF